MLYSVKCICSILGKVSTPTENLKVTKTFQVWMDDHANFRTICEEGKGEF